MRQAATLSCLFFLSTLASAQDFQQWNEIDLTASWRNLDVLVPLLTRTDTHLPNPQLAATGFIANYRAHAHLLLTAAYLYAYLPSTSDSVHLPVIAFTPVFRLNRLTLADTSRFEKLIGYPGAPVRYRNKLFFDRPLGPHKRWHLFAGDEVFFNLSAASWNQNRLQAGAGSRLNSRLSLDAYYLQRVANGAAESTNVMGTTLTVRMTPDRKGR